MTWSDYLARLQAKNPQLANQDAKMTITVASFLKQLQRAHEAGRGESAGKRLFDKFFGGTTP